MSTTASTPTATNTTNTTTELATTEAATEVTPFYTIHCPCGKCKIDFKEPPLGSFFCHCRACRLVTQCPVSQNVVFFASAVSPTDAASLMTFQPLPEIQISVNRCKECQVNMYLSERENSLAVVPTAVLERCCRTDSSSTLPIPTAHCWYSKRVLNCMDDLPKFQDLPREHGGTGILLQSNGMPLAESSSATE